MSTPSFPVWLRQNGYREATIEAYARHVETLTTRGAQHLNPVTLRNYRRGWEALRTYQRATEQPVSEPLELPETPHNPRARQQKRRRTISAWPEATWLALLEAARGGSEPEDAALAVLISTGLRASDVLRIERVELERFQDTGRFRFEAKGGIDRDLLADPGQADDMRVLAAGVQDAHVRNVAAFVTRGASDSTLPASAAYCRLRDRLLHYCRQLGFPPLRLHDARHTIALRVYMRNRNDHPELAVMALLGHANLQTTMLYLRSLVPGQEAQASVGVPRRRT